MDSNAIMLIAGVLFLAIAIVGGGFTLERIQVPTVPRWSRIASGALGALFLGIFFYLLQSDETPEETQATGSSETPESDVTIESGGSIELNDYDGSNPTEDDIELTEFRVLSPSSQPSAGDTITVEFDLKNVGAKPIAFVNTFVGARDSGDNNEDFGDAEQEVRLGPNETLPRETTQIMNEAGVWEFWPCYELSDGSVCPDEWNAFTFNVED